MSEFDKKVAPDSAAVHSAGVVPAPPSAAESSWSAIGGHIGGQALGPAGSMIGAGAGHAAEFFYGMYDDVTSNTGLGGKVDELTAKSPTLTKNVEALRNDHWSIRYGEKGSGSYTDPDTKSIVIDATDDGNTSAVVQTLSHESGHARYTRDPEVSMVGATKDDYVHKNMTRHLKDEGEATITNVQVEQEVLHATADAKLGTAGVDIGVAGAQAAQYKALAAKYPDPKDRDKLREEVGKVFEHGEIPSTDAKVDYGKYYSQPYEHAWDSAHWTPPWEAE